MRTLFLLGLLNCSVLNAQNWAISGATWQYLWDGVGAAGFSEYSYSGDTIVNGYNAQKIAGAWHMYGSPDTSYSSLLHITRYDESSDIVYLLSNDGSLWDTLYWFNAQVGDTWTRGSYEVLPILWTGIRRGLILFRS